MDLETRPIVPILDKHGSSIGCDDFQCDGTLGSDSFPNLGLIALVNAFLQNQEPTS